MKKIVKGPRAILSNDDGTGKVGIFKGFGGLFTVRTDERIELYRGYDEREAARVIDNHLNRNKRLLKGKK